MKLLYCTLCKDVVRILLDQKRKCRCKKSMAAYTSFNKVEVAGNGVVIDIVNGDFQKTLDVAVLTNEVVKFQSSIYSSNTKTIKFLSEEEIRKRKQKKRKENKEKKDKLVIEHIKMIERIAKEL